MKPKIAHYACLSVLIAATVCALSSCTSVPRNVVENQAAQVKLYGADQLLPAQYEHVSYLWADSWRTALWLPGATSEAESIASLQVEAARVGANGLINVSCMDQGQGHFRWSRRREPSILCYGHAIRVR